MYAVAATEAQVHRFALFRHRIVFGLLEQWCTRGVHLLGRPTGVRVAVDVVQFVGIVILLDAMRRFGERRSIKRPERAVHYTDDYLAVHGISFAESQPQRWRTNRFLVDLLDVLGESIALQKRHTHIVSLPPHKTSSPPQNNAYE